MVSDSVFTTLINALAGNPAFLLLAVVLVGVGFLAYKAIGLLEGHVQAALSSVEKMGDSLKAIQDDIHELKVVLTEKKSS